VAQLYPQAPATHFGQLLQPTWAAVGLSSSLVTTRGKFQTRYTVFHILILHLLTLKYTEGDFNVLNFIHLHSKKFRIGETFVFSYLPFFYTVT